MIIKRQKTFANPKTLNGMLTNAKRHGKRYLKYKGAFLKAEALPVELKQSDREILEAVDRARRIKLQNNPSFLNRLKYSPA